MYKKEEDKRNGDVPKDGQGPDEGKNQFVREVAHKKYEYGFSTDSADRIIERGLNEDVVRLISSKKEEPEWMLEKRLKALAIYDQLDFPPWGPDISELDMQHIDTYVRPKDGHESELGGSP